MSILQKFLIPRHGNQSVMAGKSSLVLKRGEFFIETPNNGPGTGHCKIKIGDGVTPYPTLPYAMGDTNAEVSSSLISFDDNSSAKASEALGAVVSGAQLKDMVAGFKQSISLLISAQKSFTTITDGTKSIHADSAADTLKITGGTNTTVSYDVSNKAISISSKDTTYDLASSTNAGITKLYNNTGSSVDGSMTQKAITDNINAKLDANTIDYIKDINYVDHTATVTYGNGSTTSFNTADTNTTYDVFKGTDGETEGHFGLVPTPSTADSNKYLASDGTWTDFDSVKVSNASKADVAVSDTGGNNINSTYVKNVTYSGHTVTVTKGNGTTSSFDTADSNNTYSAGSGITLTGSQFAINPDASTVSYATTAASADKATDDSDGQAINATYIKNASVSGRTVTFTKGNGSTFSIDTQDTDTDTKYTAGTGISLSGNAFSINQGASTVSYATSAGSATKATNDSAGNNINSTYIKDVAVSGRNVTFTKGNGSTVGIVTQDTNTDTTYKTGTTSSSGLTKLYTGTGTALDGTMTQNAITNLVNSTKSELNSAIGAINSFEIVVLDTVDDLPANGKDHTVYFVPVDTGTDENAYDEFIWLPLTSSYEQIGVTTADLSKYYTKTDVDSKISSTKNSLVKNITYSGHTVTVTFGNGSTTSFNTADNNTTYDAGTGLSLSGNTFSINSGASTVAYAGKAGSANSAGAATNDSAGNDIHNTYIKDVSVNGRNITFTKGNGSTVGITTQDTNTDTNTTYSAGTGLSLTGTSFSINQGASTVAYAKNSGWASSAGAATTADKIATARNIKIGSSSKKFDGSSDVSYSLSEIGAQPSGYYTTASMIGTNTPGCTVDDIFELRRGTTGGVGSVNIKQKSSGLGSEIPSGWYNYIYSPHRTGIGDDNDYYATVILCPMTFAGESYILRYSSGSLAECRAFVLDNQLASQSSNGLMSAADKKAIDREFFRMLPKGGTVIPNGADLNSTAYIKVGNYYQPAIANTTNMTNIPVKLAFTMYVLSPLSEAYDNESTNQWVYRLRIFVDYTGNNIFTQLVSSGTTPGSFNYGPWVKITNADDLGAVSNTINTHIANKSNPHAVTKAQVGLGSVANLDQSKAIKSITRSGTTFTATALDGTTSTFTQQDNNTTYSAGTGLSLSGTSFSINPNASTVSYAKNANWANGASYSNYIGGAGVSTNALRDNTCFDFGYEG